jgi:hypothetical protein
METVVMECCASGKSCNSARGLCQHFFDSAPAGECEFLLIVNVDYKYRTVRFLPQFHVIDFQCFLKLSLNFRKYFNLNRL